MVIWIRRRYMAEAALTLVLFCCMTAVLWQSREAVPAAAGGLSGGRNVYIVDAGHGGEDGGAVAGDGTV